MKGRITILAAVALTGCTVSEPRNDAPPAREDAPQNLATPDNMAEAAEAEAQKSILRPEVVPTLPEKPALEPIDRVVPFGDSGLKLGDAARRLLDELLGDPVMAAGGPVRLEGHSDTRGSDGDNRVASRVRAEAVRDYLIEKGVAAGRLTIVALGETRALAPNAKPDGSDDPEGRARNRRVEVHVDLPPDAGDSAPEDPAGNTSDGR